MTPFGAIATIVLAGLAALLLAALGILLGEVARRDRRPPE